jgi:microcystin-dependent protein
MPDTYTPGLALIKPEVGASRDSWGSKTNTNWDTLDQFVSQAMPIGAVLDFAGPNAPSGWLICDGRAVSRTTYSDLFAVVGTYWGAGDGSTTFTLPNPTGRASIGPGTVTDQGGLTATFGFATTAGYVWNTIAQAHLPNYALYIDAQGQHSHGGASVAAGGHNHTTDAQGNHSHGGQTTTESVTHVHAGTTDTQGDHQHSYTQTVTNNGDFIGSGHPGVSQTGAWTSAAGAHAHNVSTNTESAFHVHFISADGSHAHNVSWVGDHQHAIYADGNHTHNVWLNGSGQAFEVLSPVMVVTKIIYAGNQASTRAALAAAPAATSADAAEEMATIREELAALRAMLMPATRRVVSSPGRGPH